MSKILNVDPKSCISAAEIFGSKERPDKIEISADLIHELAVYAKALSYLMSGQSSSDQIASSVVKALAKLDGFRHFDALLKTEMAEQLLGANASRTVAVESEDSVAVAETALVSSGLFRRTKKSLFLEPVSL